MCTPEKPSTPNQPPQTDSPRPASIANPSTPTTPSNTSSFGGNVSSGNPGTPSPRPNSVSTTPQHQLMNQQENASSPASGGAMNAPSGRQVPKRRMRRRATSQSQDPAEQLTEMSVRGLNLFRYASISEGVYQCTECAKVDIQKTFKNKYSFQRHAFLYHEGHQRKVFPCPVCRKEFSRPDKMKNHMKTVHDCFMPKDCVMPFNFFLSQ